MPPDSHATTARIESVIRELYSIALSALADFWDFDYKFPINLFNRQRRNQNENTKGPQDRYDFERRTRNALNARGPAREDCQSA
jgi:hypothetical protein